MPTIPFGTIGTKGTFYVASPLSGDMDYCDGLAMLAEYTDNALPRTSHNLDRQLLPAVTAGLKMLHVFCPCSFCLIHVANIRNISI